MEKLTLKELAPYAVYGLKGKQFVNKEISIVTELDFVHNIVSTLNDGNFLVTDFQPILRPMTDILKDEYWFMFEGETDWESINDWIKLDNQSLRACKFTHDFWEELYHYHFDVFGLIEKGLAIDINTIK